MGGVRAGRLWSAVVIVAAIGALVSGSWLVVGAATGSTPAHGMVATAVHHKTASRTLDPPTTGTTAPVTTPPTTQPVATSLAPPTSSPAPTTTAAVAPAARSVPVAPAVITTAPPATPRVPKQRSAQSAVAGRAPTQDGPVAAQLIGAINQQAKRQGPIPETADNVSLLGRWMANEGGLWADNPLNTSLGAASYPHQYTASGQDTGIPIFSNLSSGLAATATTLLSNPSYARILKVLRSGKASCLQFAKAVIQSPWASGHYDHNPAGFCEGRIVPAHRGHKPRHAR